MEHRFRIQFLAEGNDKGGVNPAVNMVECNFTAPDEKIAKEFADRVSVLYSEMGLVPQAYRPYQTVMG